MNPFGEIAGILDELGVSKEAAYTLGLALLAYQLACLTGTLYTLDWVLTLPPR